MKVPVLIYHDVIASRDAKKLSPRERYYTTTAETFDQHLNLLVTESFVTLMPGQPPRSGRRAVMLTFDDGLQSAFHCHQRLARYGFSGIFFIVTDFVGRPSHLSWDQLRTMQANGMSIQSHTCSHPILTAIGPSQILEEFTRSKAVLEDQLGQRAEALSIPQGFLNEEILTLARQCGYRYIFTSRPGLYRVGVESAIPRLSIYRHTDLKTFRGLVHGNWFEIGRQKIRKFVLSIPKRLLGDRGYHRLRQAILRRQA